MSYLTYTIHLCNSFQFKTCLREENFIFSNIMLYYKKNQMSKIKAKKLSLKFAPYLFIAVTILTAFGSNSGTWV